MDPCSALVGASEKKYIYIGMLAGTRWTGRRGSNSEPRSVCENLIKNKGRYRTWWHEKWSRLVPADFVTQRRRRTRFSGVELTTCFSCSSICFCFYLFLVCCFIFFLLVHDATPTRRTQSARLQGARRRSRQRGERLRQ